MELERSFLPAVNAILNSSAALLLCLGYLAIRARRERLHKGLMIAASVVSALFLCSYLTHHYHFGSTRFPGEGWVRPFYLGVLLSHIVLAAALAPLVLMTLWRAFKDDRARHRRIARWTLPIWLYVSVTGVMVYLMLYQLYAPAG